MEWRDQGLVLARRGFGENGVILDVFTREHGRQSGLVYGGMSSRKRATLEEGTELDLEWRGKSADQLGHFSVCEPLGNRMAGYLGSRLALSGVMSVTALLNTALPDGEAYPSLYDGTQVLLDQLSDQEVWPALMVRWEAGFLSSVGYGLAIEKCALTGSSEGLTHVSPRTGRAVCGSAASEYLDKLLKLPAFFVDASHEPTATDISDGFALTGYFLGRRLYGEAHRTPPSARDRMLRRLENAGVLGADQDED